MKGTVIASGNLATPRRTVIGVLSQCLLFELDQKRIVEIFTRSGLPARAMEELDFPISLDQELVICNEMVRTLNIGRSPTYTVFSTLNKLGIELLGVLGMAMRHASTAIEALKVCLTYPQLTGGHSRLVVRRQSNEILFSFTMDRPRLRNTSEEEIDNLVQYCLTLDLIMSLGNLGSILPSGLAPLYIHLPFQQPDDWQELPITLPCPVYFAQPEACLAYPANLDAMLLPDANPLLYRSYVSIAEKMSLMLAEEFTLAERVSRWLWAYTPPPNRGEVAALLTMSERNLTRQLGREDTSYSRLLAQVQEERAKNLLKRPELSIAEIGYRLGYAEPAVFSRAFRHWTGIPPGRWRKNQLTPS